MLRVLMFWFTVVALVVAPCAGLAQKGGFGTTAKKKPSKAAKPMSLPIPANGVVRSELDMPQFMGAFVMEESVVDGVLKLFEEAAPVRGMISKKGGQEPLVDLSVKDSFETSVAPNDRRAEWTQYLRSLMSCASLYVETYPFAAAYGVWQLNSRTNIQRYPPSGGYKTYHTERTGKGEPEGSRHLVFMTYLNDVHDQGGTEFVHQNVTIQPRKGLTLIWPADWTFTHRGVPSPTETKTITTGWFNYVA